MKPCPFCFGAARLQRQRGAMAEILHAVACLNERCLAVGPIGRTEKEATEKWDQRNLNIAKSEPRVTMAPVIGKAK
jgi:hypothetical protein